MNATDHDDDRTSGCRCRSSSRGPSVWVAWTFRSVSTAHHRHESLPPHPSGLATLQSSWKPSRTSRETFLCSRRNRRAVCRRGDGTCLFPATASAGVGWQATEASAHLPGSAGLEYASSSVYIIRWRRAEARPSSCMPPRGHERQDPAPNDEANVAIRWPRRY